MVIADCDPITIYTFAGSQFSAKVLTALDANQIPHYVTFVSLMPKSRVLPSGGKLVPEMVVGDGSDRVVVADSEAILRWLDANRGTRFFPTEQAAAISQRASDGVLAGAVIYYNWVHTPTYNTTMRAHAVSKRGMPDYILCCRGQLVDYLTSKQRRSFATLAAKQERQHTIPTTRIMATSYHTYGTYNLYHILPYLLQSL